MEFKFHGKISLEDYVAFNKYYLKIIFFKGWRKIIFFLCVIIILLSISFNMYNGINNILDVKNQMPEISDSAQIDLLMIKLIAIHILKEFGIIFFILMLFIIFNFLFKRNLRKHYYSNKLFNEEQYYTVTEDQIEIKTAISNALITKDKINRILYNKNVLYIFIALNMAYIIPESFFSDSDEFINFKSFMNENYNIVRNKK